MKVHGRSDSSRISGILLSNRCPINPSPYRVDHAEGIAMNSEIPTHVGDVLILLTDESFYVHAVGQVTNEGQQDFDTYDRGQQVQTIRMDICT